MHKFILQIAFLTLILFMPSCGDEDSPQTFDCILGIDLSISECPAEHILNTCFFYRCDNDNNHNESISGINRFEQNCEMIDCTTIVCDDTLYEDILPVDHTEFSTIILDFTTLITNEEFIEEEAICVAMQS